MKTETIDVWRISPLRRAGNAATLKSILPVEEIARIERYSNDLKRNAAITSRAALRLILAHYTHLPANELVFGSGINGKPYLSESQNTDKLTFNFADSSDMALLAVGWNREVGVDVEKVREVPHAEQIARRRFSPEAADEVRDASTADRSRSFLQKWARHEALLKARSGRLWSPGGEMENLTNSKLETYVEERLDFTVSDLDTGRIYVGALAAEGAGWTVAVKDYTD